MLEIQFTDSIKVPCREEYKPWLNGGDKKKPDIKDGLDDSPPKTEPSQVCPCLWLVKKHFFQENVYTLWSFVLEFNACFSHECLMLPC